MTTTFTKTAAATFAAAFALTGAALADDATLIDNIYAQMEADKAQTVEIVNASADERVSKMTATIDEADAAQPAESFALASN